MEEYMVKRSAKSKVKETCIVVDTTIETSLLRAPGGGGALLALRGGDGGVDLLAVLVADAWGRRAVAPAFARADADDYVGVGVSDGGLRMGEGWRNGGE
jgi:hypothetical protein